MIDAYSRPDRISRPISFPLPSALGHCIVVDNFLSATECRAYIAQAESKGFGSASPDYPPSYRNNDRLVVDDTALAQKLYERLPFTAADPDRFEGWRMDSVNTRLRFCRYTSNQQFNIHQDGVHHRSPDFRSLLTFMIYLNDGSEFSGGDTLFYANGPRTAPDANPVVGRFRPKMGSLILFDHTIWHAGETVSSGTKYIMRSDVLFRRAGTLADTTGPTHDRDSVPSRRAIEGLWQHRGYVWTLEKLDDDHFASGGRDCTIRLWNDSGVCTGELIGHTQSVLGLARVDNQLLASVSRDRTLRIWNLQTRQCLRTTVAHDTAVLTVTNIGKGRLATGAADGKIKVWNLAGEALAAIPAHAGWVWKIVRLNDSLMASASEDGSIKVWSTDTFEMTAYLETPHPLRTIAASPDGATIATGDVAGQLRVWTRSSLEAEISAHDSAIRSVRFIDAETIATGSEDCRLKVWRNRPWRVCYEAQHDNFVTDFHAIDSNRGASCSYDGMIAFHTWGGVPRREHTQP